MFRVLARLLNDPSLMSPSAGYSDKVFELHAYQLTQWLEQAWLFSNAVANWIGQTTPTHPYLGSPGIVDALAFPEGPDPALLETFLRSGIPLSAANVPGFDGPPAPGQSISMGGAASAPVGLPWDHAAYALVIESTGVYEILAEVTRRYVVGETLEPPSLRTERWLRNTEALFFREAPPAHIAALVSEFRPETRVTRRNLYWRLLGMDLPHALPPRLQGPGGDQPWKRDVGIANTRFHELWVRLLRSVWKNYINTFNTSGPNEKDPAETAEIARYLKDMLVMRRLNGQLAREEFTAVTVLSWFHLTVESDTPLVTDLRAQGTDPYDRLKKIAERVGMWASPHGWELFQLADPISTLLRYIELGTFDTVTGAETLYTPGTNLQRDVLRIIDLWEMATTDQIKDRGVRLAPGLSQPQRPAPPARSLSAAAGANGHRSIAGPVPR